MITFQRRKADRLRRADKSSIGEKDEKIRKLCEKINNLENYYTLSSCSGRIVLIKNLEKKQPGMFVFKSHEKVEIGELKRALENVSRSKETLIFKQEPPILHIACKNLKDAERLLKKAQQAGMKHSGIISVASNRIIIEVIGSEQLAFPIADRGRVLVDDRFLKILVREANKRLEKGWQKINKLEKII